MGRNDAVYFELFPQFLNRITVVSGLPRSGTSMMMNMLQAGGMEVLVDHVRKPDRDNPRGYFEFEKVKSLALDAGWMEMSTGKAIKIVSALLKYLPSHLNYKVVFMQRKMAELLASQKKMLMRQAVFSQGASDKVMARKFEQHLQKTTRWLEEQKHIDVLYVHYQEVISHPVEQVQLINHFLGDELDGEKMCTAVDPSLHRNRESTIIS